MTTASDVELSVSRAASAVRAQGPAAATSAMAHLALAPPQDVVEGWAHDPRRCRGPRGRPSRARRPCLAPAGSRTSSPRCRSGHRVPPRAGRHDLTTMLTVIVCAAHSPPGSEPRAVQVEPCAAQARRPAPAPARARGRTCASGRPCEPWTRAAHLRGHVPSGEVPASAPLPSPQAGAPALVVSVDGLAARGLEEPARHPLPVSAPVPRRRGHARRRTAVEQRWRCPTTARS